MSAVLIAHGFESFIGIHILAKVLAKPRATLSSSTVFFYSKTLGRTVISLSN